MLKVPNIKAEFDGTANNKSGCVKKGFIVPLR